MSSAGFSSSPWLLPEGVEEVLPPYAGVLERARRNVLDLFAGWGYELVMPPFVEHLESLLTGTGQDLELETFKLIDQMSGRLLGVRADMTPQVARMDAHSLGRSGESGSSDAPSRLCYLGTVLRAVPDGMSSSRTPVQLGAELYGHDGVESDCEVLCLLLETLRTLGIENVHVDLGHVGIFRALARRAQLDPETEALVHDALQRKARPELETLLAARSVDSAEADRILALTQLNGDASVLERARTLLDTSGGEVGDCLDAIAGVAAEVERHRPGTQVHYDLAELRGYRYHTGIVFAAFVPGHGEEIARGGRYNEIGEVFGRARPATGFSAELKTLVSLSAKWQLADNAGAEWAASNRILAPWDADPELLDLMRNLREAGECVVQALPGAPEESLPCGRRIERSGGRWSVVTLASPR